MTNRDARSFDAVYQVMLSLSDEQVDKLLQTLQPQTRRGVPMSVSLCKRDSGPKLGGHPVRASGGAFAQNRSI
jgi:hypothetical protein